MSIKTITKIVCFVISVVFAAGCSKVSFSGGERVSIEPENAGFRRAEVVARIASKEINESSGLAVSRCQTDVFWTHNDSGDGPFIYAFNSRGEALAKFEIPNAQNIDWEDMSSYRTSTGECFLYIGEFGNNERKRDEHAIYRIYEPEFVSAPASGLARSLAEVSVLRFRYPAERHDAEALLVHPESEKIYIVTKGLDGPAHVYQLDPIFIPTEIQTALRVSEISLPASPNGFVTGGDISPDGRHVAICDYYAGYELRLPDGAREFNDVWSQAPKAFDLGPREIGEAVSFSSDGKTVYATTERLNAPLIRVVRKPK